MTEPGATPTPTNTPTSTSPSASPSTSTPTAEAIQKGAGCITLGGIGLIVLGVLAIGAPLVSGIAVAISVGVLVMISGFAVLGQGLTAAPGTRLWISLAGVLAAICGAIMIMHPVLGLGFMTMLLAIYFLFDGISSALASLAAHPAPGAGWSMISGLVSIALAVMIFAQWPLSGAWAIGVLLGVNMMLRGWSLIALGTVARGVAAGG